MEQNTKCLRSITELCGVELGKTSRWSDKKPSVLPGHSWSPLAA